jgi:hypothetical protein
MTVPNVSPKTEESGKKEASGRPWWLPAMMMFARLSVWVAAPVIAALYVGKWLDRQYGTEPWLLLATIGVAFVVSMTGLVINTLKEFKKIEKEIDKNSNDNPPAGGQKPGHDPDSKS